MSRPATLALGIILALIAGGMYWWSLDRGAATVAAPPADAVMPAEDSGDVEDLPVALPALDGSDAFIRDMLAALRLMAPLAAGLQGDELVRTFVVAVNRVADGDSPRGQLGFLDPQGSFGVAGSEDRPYLDPASYRRYDPVAAAVGGLDAVAVARTLRRLQPLLEAAQGELGTGESFDTVLTRAVQVLLEAPVLRGQVEVVDAIERYRFADAALEALAPAQKHLVRMGPDNTEIIQGQLRRVREAWSTLPQGG